MTNGMQLQADDAVGGPPPADAPESRTPAGASQATARLGKAQLAVARPAGAPTRRRTSLAVIPRRATGTHTAIPAPVSDAFTDPRGIAPQAAPAAGLPAVPAPVSMTRRRRAGLLGAAAALLAAAVAVPLWLDGHRPAPTAQQVAPVGAGLPGDPSVPGDPSAPAGAGDPSVAPPAEGIGPATAVPTPTRTADGPAAEAGIPTAPAGVVTTPARQPEDDATEDPAGQDPAQTAPPAQDPPQDQPTFEARGNPTGRNLALGQRVFASSFANRFRSPELAVDGKLLSKWSTRATNEQWIAVDLGDTFRISRVRIAWELAFANTYRVDLSTDGRSWTSVWQTRTGLGGTVGIPMDDDAAARYVRVYGVRPAGPLGYSIRELDVR